MLDTKDEIKEMERICREQLENCPDKTVGCRTCNNTKQMVGMLKMLGVEIDTDDENVV